MYSTLYYKGNGIGLISMGWSLTSGGNIQKTSIYWVACWEMLFVWPRSGTVKGGWVLGKYVVGRKGGWNWFGIVSE